MTVVNPLDTALPGRASPRRTVFTSLAALCAVLAACSEAPSGSGEPVSAPAAQALSTAPQLSPALPVPSAGQTPEFTLQQQVVATAGPGLYLLVWWEIANNSPKLFGLRVRASDGAALDASPFFIALGGASVQLDPAVAFDGTNFLVVWSDIGAYPIIRGARVRASDGAVLDATPRLISRPLSGPPPYDSGLQYAMRPAVAFDGTNYLVVWDGEWSTHQGYGRGIMGIRVGASDGVPLEPTGFPIALVSGNWSPGYGKSRVAYADGHYLVAWEQGGDIKAARVAASSGQVLDTVALSLTAGTGVEGSPAVAARQGEFLAVWTGADKGLWGRRVRASDGAKLGSADLFLGADGVAPAEVTFDAVNYWVAWQATRGGARKALVTRVKPEGAVDAELVLAGVSTDSFVERGAIASVGAGLLLSVYQGADPAGVRRPWMRLVADACGPEAPSIVLTGGAAVTLECGPGVYQDLGAQAFDACGRSLPVQGYNTGADSSGPGPSLRNEGTYHVSYTAKDASGIMSSAVRTVTVDDRTPPTLTLKGATQMTHTCGSQWVDPGVEAQDACYGNLTAQVWRSGTVNGWAVGTYTVTYSLTDSGGNSAPPLTRTVNVVNCPW
ncbi:DUF5011 domain-containing protein [Stigmatella erecta]|uniref:Pesticidal crystal protein Cry22Aa Ig-like domain-containing protein n=1 Tax=Stigmatella erecta TaxID=83460 RepID=A0A1I0KI19_9BACT|nr:DUF5011 domain-containing protein [Stigmatella erecta]SEU24233.1 protein of unknown function [Stigmatella erecta]